MAMQCIKTGAQIWMEQYGEFAYGDLYELTQGVWIMRTTAFSYTPIVSIADYKAIKIDQIWRDQPYGTIIISEIYKYGDNGIDTKTSTDFI